MDLKGTNIHQLVFETTTQKIIQQEKIVSNCLVLE